MDTCPTCFQELPVRADLTVSLDENCAIWKGIRCDLTRQQTAILYVLAAERPGRWVTFDKLIADVYGVYSEPTTENNLTVQTSYLRRKLRDAGMPIAIANSWYSTRGKGKQYRLVYQA
ncbi:MAG: winged helix-turn-helix domain-containing protein [Pseudomonadales bacterium]